MKTLLKQGMNNLKSLIIESKAFINFHSFKNWQELVWQPLKGYLKINHPYLFSKEELEKEDHPQVFSSCLEYEKLIHKVYKKIKDSNFEPDHIAAISRGGLMLGLYLSHAFNKPLVIIAAESWPKGKKLKEVKFARHSVFTTETVEGKILLADDMTESGDSFIEGKKYLKRKFLKITKIKTASIFHKEWSKYKPDYHGKTLRQNKKGQIPWIVQPFELSREEN